MTKRFYQAADKSCFILSSIEDYHDLTDEYTFKIIWVTAGTMVIELELEEMKIHSHQLVCLAPNQRFRVIQAAEGCIYQYNREFYCIVDHDHEISCVGLLYYGTFKAPILQLDEQHQRKFQLLHEVFMDEFDTIDTIQEAMLRMLLKRLIIICTRLLKEQHASDIGERELEVIRKFHLLLEQHFRSRQTVAEYAELLFKSPKTLSNLFSQNGQKPPLKQIQDRIALEAKRLILYTDKSIKEISWELNFEEVAHFSRFFKRNTGFTPTAFREQKTSLNKGKIGNAKGTSG